MSSPFHGTRIPFFFFWYTNTHCTTHNSQSKPPSQVLPFDIFFAPTTTTRANLIKTLAQLNQTLQRLLLVCCQESSSAASHEMLVTHHKVSAIVQRWMKDYTVGKENELYTESVSIATFRDEVRHTQFFFFFFFFFFFNSYKKMKNLKSIGDSFFFFIFVFVLFSQTGT